MSIKDEILGLPTSVKIGGSAALIGASLVSAAALVRKSRKKRAKNKRKSGKVSYRRSSVRRSRSRKIRRSPRTAGKRRDRSTRRIRYTKNGQPYIILRSGKARFIKQKSAKSSHKRSGGRY